MLKKITENPFFNLLAGVILLITAGYETWESFGEFSLGAHHGVAVFGLFQTIKYLPETLHGLKEVQEGEEGFGGKNK